MQMCQQYLKNKQTSLSGTDFVYKPTEVFNMSTLLLQVRVSIWGR